LWEKDIFAVHPKWLERHMRHFRDALYHLERGDGMAACYNAYVSVEALLKGVLGYSPYGDLQKVDRLPSLLKRAIGASPPDVEECAEYLERKAFSEEGARCVKCAELVINAVYRMLESSFKAPSRSS